MMFVNQFRLCSLLPASIQIHPHLRHCRYANCRSFQRLSSGLDASPHQPHYLQPHVIFIAAPFLLSRTNHGVVLVLPWFWTTTEYRVGCQHAVTSLSNILAELDETALVLSSLSVSAACRRAKDLSVLRLRWPLLCLNLTSSEEFRQVMSMYTEEQ